VYSDTTLATFWENLLHPYVDVLEMWEKQDIDAGMRGGRANLIDEVIGR